MCPLIHVVTVHTTGVMTSGEKDAFSIHRKESVLKVGLLVFSLAVCN